MKKISTLCFVMLSLCVNTLAQNKTLGKQFTDFFGQDSCSFQTTGHNNYFILEPGYQLVLEGMEGKDKIKLVITVLNETKKIGNVETRIVEENESANGKTVEISRNYFAFCKQTGSVFYFGEEVDMYKNGKIINHEGAWIAEGNNKPGIMMPGIVLLGARFYNEIAPGVAMDRVEIISLKDTLQTPAGIFYNCLKTEETTPLEPKTKEYKLFTPGIGLIKDGDLLLTKYGFVK